MELVLTASACGLSLLSLRDLQAGKEWKGAAGNAWLWLEMDGHKLKEWRLHGWHVDSEAGALRLEVEFTAYRVSSGEPDGFLPFLSAVESVWIPNDLPVIRHWVSLQNPGGQPLRVHRFHLLDLAVDHDLADEPLRLFYVDGFAGHRHDRWDPGDLNFACHEMDPGPGGMLRLGMGAYQQQCSWLAARDPDGAGLALGLEYDGAAELRFFDIRNVPAGSFWEAGQELGPGVRFTASPPDALNITLLPGETWQSPAVFLLTFSGACDRAAHLTHELVEGYFAPPWPDLSFPYAAFNTWGYAFDLTPQKVWRCLEVATEIGAEVFEADYGWAPRLGDWTSVERNFPPLEVLTARVHAQGLKFGLWMSFANADPQSRVVIEHPDWLASPDAWGSFGSRALCLAHAPARVWAAEQAVRVVTAYGVDHFKHDFELITPCTNPGHTHPPDPSGYHSMLGYQEVLRRLRLAHPRLVIENCEGGGRIMTYDMVKLHDTSIVSDGPVLAHPLARRSALYGACYPFPLRYCDNYMEDRPTDTGCHSSMIGGPWILMSRAAEWTPDEIECARRNIALYKRLRPIFRGGRVYHLRMPDGAHWDGLQVQQPSGKEGVVYLFQPSGSRDKEAAVLLYDLQPDRTYCLQNSSGAAWQATGAVLMRDGLRRPLAPGESEIILLI